MKVVYCENCAKETAHKRQFSLGFFVGVVLTGGLWLITIPLAPLRCSECGTEELRKSAHFHRREPTPYDSWE
jgi:hypothetical protein